MNELMASLAETVDVFLAQQKVEVREEEERSAREMIMMQQDAAFRESLEMDRAKEEARRHQEQVDNLEKERELQLREEEAAKKEVRVTIRHSCVYFFSGVFPRNLLDIFCSKRNG